MGGGGGGEGGITSHIHLGDIDLIFNFLDLVHSRSLEVPPGPQLFLLPLQCCNLDGQLGAPPREATSFA
jgi:hypothetical protein